MDIEQIKEILKDKRAWVNNPYKIGEGLTVDDWNLNWEWIEVQLEASLPQVGEDGILTDEEMAKAIDPFTPPTKEEWQKKPDHIYWQERRLLKAQALATTIREREKARQELDKMIEDYRTYCKGAPEDVDWKEFLFNTLDNMQQVIKRQELPQ